MNFKSISLIIGFIIGQSLFAQPYNSISWHRKVGTNFTTSYVILSDISSDIGSRVYQVGTFVGFSNFKDETINSIVIPNATNVSQGYLSVYNSASGSLDSVVLLQSPNNLYIHAVDVDSTTKNIVISGHFKDYFYYYMDTIHSPHPYNNTTGFIMLLDSNLNMINSYVKSYQNSYGDWMPLKIRFHNSRVYTYAYGVQGYSEKFEIVKFDPNLNLLWGKTISSNEYKQLSDLLIDDDGNIYFTGFTYMSIDVDPDPSNSIISSSSYFNQSGDGFLISLDSNGLYRWHYRLESNTSSADDLHHIEKLGNNLFVWGVMGGTSANLNPNGTSVTSTYAGNLIKLNPSNGVLKDFLPITGGLFYSGSMSPKDFSSKEGNLHVYSTVSGSFYLGKNQQNLFTAQNAMAVIQYDTNFIPAVLCQLDATHPANGKFKIENTSDGGELLAFSGTASNGAMQLVYRDSTGSSSTVYSYDNQGSFKFIQVKFKRQSCTGLTSPTTTAVSYCLGSSATALTAVGGTGSTLQWYGTNATGGTASATAPTPSTATAGTTTYYVSQLDANGCESPRAAIVVTVNASNIIGFSTSDSIYYPTKTTALFYFICSNCNGQKWQSNGSGMWLDMPANMNNNGVNSDTLVLSGYVPGTAFELRSLVQYGNCFDTSITMDFHAYNGIGVHENEPIDDLALYPNPASQFIQIEVSEGSILKISLYDGFGKLVYHLDDINYNKAKIDLTDLAAGIYYLQAKTSINNYIERVVIQR